MLFCFVVKNSHHTAQNDNRPYHFSAKNEYIDGRFLAGDCGSRQRQVADGADVVFTDTHNQCKAIPNPSSQSSASQELSVLGCHEIPHRTTARTAPKYMLGL